MSSDTDYSEFTSEQLDAINSDAKRLLVLAPPGSGKSRTLNGRIDRMIDDGSCGEDGMDAVCAVTFTNAAADKMLDQLNRMGITPGFCGTLHALMLRWVRAWHELEGMGRPGLMPPHEIDGLLMQCNDELRAKLSLKKIKEALEEANSGCGTGMPLGLAGQVVARYRQVLAQNSLYDYDTLLLSGLEYMRRITGGQSDLRFAQPGMEAGLLLKLRHLYVDEFQDASRLDIVIYDEGPFDSRTFVGDPDQAIYGFRGGDVTGMIDMAAREGTEIVELTRNFRSTQPICDAAFRLVAVNLARLNRQPMVGRAIPTPRPPATHPPHVFMCKDALQEQQHVVDRVRAWCHRYGAENVAVLTRTNAQATDYRAKLGAAGIPLQERQQVGEAGLGEALTWLALCANPRSNLLASLYLKNQAHRMEQPLGAAVIDAATRGLALNDVLKIVPDSGPYTPVRELMATYTPLAPESSVLDELAARCGAMLDLMPGDLLAGLKNAPLNTMPTQVRQPGVTVTTIHAAKGLEWSAVVMPGWNNELFPLRNADIEEERRVAFVGITRAKEEVDITWCKELVSPWPPFRKSPGTPSIFITNFNQTTQQEF